MFTITKVIEEIVNKNVGCVWKQTVFSILASLPFFTQGLETTHLPTFFISSAPSNEVPWALTIRLLASIASAPGFGYVVARYGRKCGVYLAVLAQGLSCIPLFLNPNDVTSAFLHLFTGISHSGIFITIPIYIREINHHNPALMMSVTTMMTNLGQIVRMMIKLESMMYIMVVMIIIQFLSVWAMVESPSYLVTMDEYEKAAGAFAKLKCLNKDEEFVKKEIDLLVKESKTARENGSLTLFGILRYAIWRDIIMIGLVLYTTTTLCGSIVFLDHRKTLLQLKLDEDPADVMVYICMMAGAVFCLVTIRFLERRVLLTVGYTTIVISMGVLGVYTQTDLTIRSLRWLPVVCLGILIFGYGVVRDLPLITMIEMLNLEIRTTVIVFLHMYWLIISLMHEHTFFYIEEYIGIYTILYICVGININALIYSMFRLPDIKNKSVRQIEKQMKRVPLFDF